MKEFIILRKGLLNYKPNALFHKIFIETISYCNNDCMFCPASNKTAAKNPNHFMLENLFMKIVNELSSMHFEGSVAFHCNNEPLLDKRLTSWIKIARSLLKTNYFYLYTNGMFINVNLANELFEAGLNRIIINNYNDKHELISPLRNLVENFALLKGEVVLSYRAKTEYLGNRAGENPSALFVLRRSLNIICLRPLYEIVVGYDGTVPLCCADGLWKVVMGDLKNLSLKEIWFSDFFKKIRESLIRRDRNYTEICKVCDALSFSASRGIRG